MKFALKSYNSHQDEFVCIYDMDELSLYTSDCGTDGSLVVNGTYICLDFDIKTQEVKGISGFVGNLADLKSVKVSNVNTKYDAKLVVDADEAFMAGIGYGINLEYEIMYDKFNILHFCYIYYGEIIAKCHFSVNIIFSLIPVLTCSFLHIRFFHTFQDFQSI